jgi:rhamnulokinase
MTSVVAVDLGAASARVVLGEIGRETLDLRELHRVPNEPVQVGNTLHWDILRLYGGVLDGLRRAAGDAAAVDSVGVDSWAVDYGLIDRSGALLGNPVHYRDRRTEGAVEAVSAVVGAEELYATTGIQQLPINTIYQLAAARGSAQLAAADTLLLIPDLIGYWLTGEIGAEVTNASTTQLFDLHRETWSDDLIGRLDLPAGIFPPLRRPGDRVGVIGGSAADETGLAVPVTAVGSHDTASAVVAVPARNERFGYISCGTWSLVGVELDKPVLSADSRAANFTNERGIDGTVRYLRNVMGLWLLQESQRTWRGAGQQTDVAELLAAAAAEPALRAVVDPDDPAFLAPGDMPARIAAACRRTGQPVPDRPAAVVRTIIESLALAHRVAIRAAQRLSGRAIDAVHMVGGGARNDLLCQLTADACDLPVLAGPVEATSIGNVLVQARALGAVGDLVDMRRLVAATHQVRRFEPKADERAWSSAAARAGLADP